MTRNRVNIKANLSLYNNEVIKKLEADFFFNFRYMWFETNLRSSSSIEETGEIVPAIIGCWLVGWVLTYVCLFKV